MSVRRITQTHAAEKDFAHIVDYLDEHYPGVGDRFAADLESTCRILASQPKSGRPRDDLSHGLRSKVVGQHVVFFQATDDELLVVRIIHGSRDIDRVFREPDEE